MARIPVKIVARVRRLIKLKLVPEKNLSDAIRSALADWLKKHEKDSKES
jgi:Arc/MetJ-type ribon-helix-helix transcriptional regulator